MRQESHKEKSNKDTGGRAGGLVETEATQGYRARLGRWGSGEMQGKGEEGEGESQGKRKWEGKGEKIKHEPGDLVAPVGTVLVAHSLCFLM